VFFSKCLQGFGLRAGKKKVEKCVLLLLVNWLLGNWLSILSGKEKELIL